jgi:rhodanese-related sulfurtransferase
VTLHRSRVGGGNAAPGYLPRVSAIDDLLATCRRDLDRVTARDLPAEVADGALVVDTRPVEQRLRDGELPGAVVVDRNVLEWRLDPTSPYRMPEATSADLRVIVVCDEGYSSSLVAHTLRTLGLHRATDLVGGYQAWLRQRTLDALAAGRTGPQSRSDGMAGVGQDVADDCDPAGPASRHGRPVVPDHQRDAEGPGTAPQPGGLVDA